MQLNIKENNVDKKKSIITRRVSETGETVDYVITDVKKFIEIFDKVEEGDLDLPF